MEPRRVESRATSEAKKRRHKIRGVLPHLQSYTFFSNLMSTEASEVSLGRRMLRYTTQNVLCKVADDEGKVQAVLDERKRSLNSATSTA